MGKKSQEKKEAQAEEIKKAEEITGEKVDKLAEARQVLAEEKAKRATDCGKELDAVCKKYNCILVPNAHIVINGQQLGVVVQAN